MIGKIGTFGVAALLMVSCAESPQQTVVPKEPEPPKSKPVQIPVGREEKGKSMRMGLDDLYPLQQSGDVLIYDVRAAYFYNIDHIPGAVNWPYTKYDEEIQQRDIEIQEARNAGKTVVLYCTSLLCSEARNVAKKLARRGYDVSVLTMGIDSWRDAGLPLNQ